MNLRGLYSYIETSGLKNARATLSDSMAILTVLEERVYLSSGRLHYLRFKIVPIISVNLDIDSMRSPKASCSV